MTTEDGPDRAAPLDAAARRRRNWGTSAGVLLVIAAVVVVALVVAGNTAAVEAGVGAGHHAGGGRCGPEQLGGSPPSAAPTTSADGNAPGRQVPTTAPGRRRPALDVDGDGRPDTASTRFVDKHTARVVVHLATGKSLTSKAFPLYQQAGAGKVFAADVNGDHRSELLVSDPGADGIGYDLFAYVGSSLVAVPVPKGNGLYIGGGMYYDSSFGCAGGRLVQVKERPDLKSTAHLPADPRFLVTTTTYALTGGVLSDGRLDHRRRRQPGRRCGQARCGR